jgi:hypothetical protein
MSLPVNYSGRPAGVNLGAAKRVKALGRPLADEGSFLPLKKGGEEGFYDRYRYCREPANNGRGARERR